MRTYSIGLGRVQVFEPAEARPDDAVAVHADGEIVCYVGRVAAMDAEQCMVEAAQRHIRLKMMHRTAEGPLRFPKVQLSAANNGAREVLKVSLLKRAPRRKPPAPGIGRIF